MDHLTYLQRRFVNEYVKDGNAARAARDAGYAESGAKENGHHNLQLPHIQEAIAERQSELAVAQGVTKEWLVKKWYEIATADNSELIAVHRTCCRHCHGYDHRYQWTSAEYITAVDTAINEKRDAPCGMGGFGYDPGAEPHPGCPECGGQGYEHVHVADSRKLSAKGKKLYAGVKKTKDGIQVLMRDQDAALANLAKACGLFIDKKEISGPGGAPLAIAHLDANDLTDDQLAMIIGAADASEGTKEAISDGD